MGNQGDLREHCTKPFDLLFKIPFQWCKIQVCTCLLTVGDMISLLSIAGFCGEDRGECYDQVSRWLLIIDYVVQFNSTIAFGEISVNIL